MDFVSVRIITDDVGRLAEFYERATGVQASWPNENFAELATASAALAIDALGQPVAAAARSRRQPRQLLHARHPGRHRQVRPLRSAVPPSTPVPARTERS
jgi:hypothetical protein